MSILVLGDIHLGLPKGPGLTWALNALEAAHENGAQGFICAGDVIDRRNFTQDTYMEVSALFSTAVELFGEVHFISGNHDVHHDLKFPDGVIPHSPQPHVFEYHGISVHTAAVAQDPDPRPVIEEFAPNTDEDKPHLGILHTGLHGIYSRKPCLPATADDLLRLNYDAWVLAHVHRPIVLSQEPFIGWVGMGMALLVTPSPNGSLEVTNLTVGEDKTTDEDFTS